MHSGFSIVKTGPRYIGIYRNNRTNYACGYLTVRALRISGINNSKILTIYRRYIPDSNVDISSREQWRQHSVDVTLVLGKRVWPAWYMSGQPKGRCQNPLPKALSLPQRAGSMSQLCRQVRSLAGSRSQLCRPPPNLGQAAQAKLFGKKSLSPLGNRTQDHRLQRGGSDLWAS